MVQAMPEEHIFTDEGQGIIPHNRDDCYVLLGILNSALVAYYLSLTSGLQKHIRLCKASTDSTL